MWILGLLIIVVLAGCIVALFLGGGEQGPFLALSKFGASGKIYGTRGQTDFQDDLRKPRDESQLL